MLEQTVNEMQGDLIKMRQASAQVLASQKQLEAKYKAAQVRGEGGGGERGGKEGGRGREEHVSWGGDSARVVSNSRLPLPPPLSLPPFPLPQSTADEWYRRAELALQKGDDDLAREALTRRKSYSAQAESMATQLEAQAKAADTLITNTRALEAKLVEAKSKKDTLKARAKSAAASKAVSDMVQGLNTSNAAVAFERMEEKVLALEGEAEATAALSAPDDVDRRFAALEGGGVDDDLARMKAGLALGSGRSGPAGALPEGRAGGAAAIDVELEELRRKAAE